MHVCLLGPTVVRDVSGVVALGGARRRAVLAYLALRAGEVVPAERMVVELWGEDAPQTSANTLQQTVHRLRRLLPPDTLRTTAGGYALDIAPEQVDVAEFTARTARGRALRESGTPAAAAAEFGAALALWRGEALADFRYEPFAQAEIARLDELRLVCVEERAEALLAAGDDPGTLVAELAPLVAAHPGRERLCALLMRASYADGRQADALDAFRRLRRHLDEELGLEPSPALVELQRRVLVHDPRLAAVERSGTPPAGLPLGAPRRTSRRLVTVVCAQVLPPPDDAPLDIETWDALVSGTTAEVARVVDRHGGAVQAVVGAQLVAVFGVQSVHEDDAVRAVAAAVEAAGPPGASGVRLGVQCGVASGEALVGGTDPTAVSGDVVPRAVELARAAGPGGVVVDRHTRDLAGAALDVDDAAAGVLRVTRVRPGVRPVRLLTTTPFVGREADLGTLTDALAEVVRAGRPRSVVVVGEAGVGKTRLLRELAAAAPDALVLRGRCLPYGPSGESSTFQAVRDLVVAAGVPVPTAQALADLLAPAPDAAGVADVLAEVLGADGERRTEPAFVVWAVRRFVEVLAARRPVVLVLDDLHWAQPALLDVAEQVAVGLDRVRVPVLAVASGRPELLDQRPAWRRKARPGSVLELGTLAPQAVSRLLQVLSHGRGLAGTTREHLLEAAGGNPLFLEQLVAWTAERPERRDPQAVPPSLRALVTARLELLGPAEQDVLDVAAVLGRDVDAAAVVALLPEAQRSAAARHLAAIAARGLLVLREPAASAVASAVAGLAGSATYAFRHALIREVAYRSVPRLTRARLHERVAQWLEQTGHDDPTLAAGHDAIGFHLERSVLDRRALGADADLLDDVARHAAWHLDRAATRAAALGDAGRAAVLHRRAAAVLPQRDPDRPRALVGLGTALTELGRFEDAAAALAEAVAASRAVDSQLWEAHARVAELELALLRDVSEAVTSITADAARLLDVFARYQDDRGACRVWQLTAMRHWAASQASRAEDAWEAAAALARRTGDVSQLADILGWLASAALWGPRPVADGLDRCESYLAELEGNPLSQAVIRMHAAGLHALLGGFPAAHDLVASAVQTYDGVGATVTSVVREPAAFAAALEGDLDAAERHLRYEDAILEVMGETSNRAVVCARLAGVLALQPERLGEAEQTLALAERLAAPDDTSAAVLAGVAAARCLAAAGRLDAALARAGTAVSTAETTDFLLHQAEALGALAAVLERRGDDAGAAEVSERAVAAHVRKGVLVGAPGPRRALTSLARDKEA